MSEHTDQPSTPNPPVIDTSDWIEKDKAFATLSESIRPANKQVVFHALAAAGIIAVVVTFDGAGDSGQIEDIEVQAADGSLTLPATSVEIAQVQWGSSEISRTMQSLRDAIETLAYDFLAETHCGWENNAGAFGEFAFDVETRAITLDYNERIEDSEHTHHVF